MIDLWLPVSILAFLGKFLTHLTQPYILFLYFEFISQLDDIPEQSDMLSLILRRKDDGTIRLKEKEKACIDVETRNQIIKCSKNFSFTSMKGETFEANFSLLQQETIYGKWKVSMVYVYSWDRSNCFGEKEMTVQDVVTDGEK